MSFLKTTAIQHLNAITPAISLTANGNVGIGNTSPTSKLVVDGSGHFRGITLSAAAGLDVGYVPAFDYAFITSGNRGAGTLSRLDFEGSSFKWYNGFGTTQRMDLDSSGRLTISNQPYARGSYGGSDLAANNVLPINSFISSRGGISTSSNRFTVPIAGAYVVGYSHLAAAVGGQVGIRKNGSLISGTRSQGSGAHYCLASLTIIELAANDYIDFITISNPIHGNADYNSMWIYLYG
jgi:hypothetical protein